MTRPALERQVELPDRRATRHLGRALAGGLSAGDLVVFSGPLGSGKTFLVRALCRALGLGAAHRVTSPTFSLVHEYPTTPRALHADLYRLEGEREVLDLGLEEQRELGAALLVEWGAPFLELLGGDALLVELAVEPRRARLQATGPRSTAALAALLAGASTR